jgi:CheY-like chemotaxis protein
VVQHTVLVVDDDRDIRESLRDLLEHEGYRVRMAADGAEAVAAMEEEPPCLVILDLMMPVMDGWAFRTQQLADPRLAAIPVVILSGTTEPARAAHDLHVDEILQKPVDVPRLLSVVDRHR